MSFSAMPMPVSITFSTKSPLGSRAAATRTSPPAGVNFTAFDSRLMRICFTARESAISGGRSVGTSVRSASLPALARSLTRRRQERTTSDTCSFSLCSSNLPASIFERSRMSLMIFSRCTPLSWMSLAYSLYCSLPSGPNISRCITSEKPMTAFKGVRSS